jgi:ABC-type polysaccharide/polyol phosphate export permease
VIAADQYRVVLDLPQKGFQWWFPAFGLIFAVIGGVIIWLGRRKRWPLSRSFAGYFVVGFACLWSGLAFATMFREYLDLRSTYRHGQFSVVEGSVTNFRPMPY